MVEELDKIIVLAKIAPGLLNRLHTMLTFQCAEMHEESGFQKKLTENFPRLDTADGSESATRFKDKSDHIRHAMVDYYHTIVDVINFNERAWKVLDCLRGTQFVEHGVEVSLNVLDAFFSLLTSNIKLNFLFSYLKEDSKGSIPSPTRIAAVYCKAYLNVCNSMEPNLERVAGFLKRFQSQKSLVTALQNEAASMSQEIGSGLSQLKPVLTRWNPLFRNITSKGLFQLDKPATFATPADENHFRDLLLLERIKEWVVLCYLVVPKELQLDNSVQFLITCLQSNFVIKLHRDVAHSFWLPWQELFNTYRLNKFKLSDFNKDFKAAIQSYDHTVVVHAKHRTLLRSVAPPLLAFFSKFPNAIAPKLPMILALITHARDEVLWYFRHKEVQSPAQVCQGGFSSMFSRAAEFKLPVDDHITSLIAIVQAMSDLVMNHKAIVAAYHTSVIQNFLIEKALTTLYAFERDFAGNREVAGYIQSLISELPSAISSQRFEVIRLTWLRAMCAMSDQRSGVTKAQISAVAVALTPIIASSRLVDGLFNKESPLLGEAILFQAAHFADLYFMKKEKDQDFFELMLKSSYTNANTIKNVFAVIRTLNDSMYSCTPHLCPEEHQRILARAGQLAKHFLNQITKDLMPKLIDKVFHYTLKLRDQSHPRNIAQQIDRINAARVHAAPVAPGASTPAAITENKSEGDHHRYAPGFESHRGNRQAVFADVQRDVEQLRSARFILFELAAAVRSNPTIEICGDVYRPAEFFREKLGDNIRKFLREHCVKLQTQDQSQNLINRPTRIIALFGVMVNVYTQIDNHLPLDIPVLCRNILLDEFSGNYGLVGQNISLDRKGGIDAVSGHIIANWYASLFKTDNFTSGAFVYNPSRKCFSTVNRNNFLKGPGFQLEDYTDVNELRALCTLMGPYGLRILENVLMEEINTLVEIIKTSLTSYNGLLITLNKDFSHKDVWEQTSNGFREADMEVLMTRTTLMGCILNFRVLVRDAQEYVTRNAVPSFYNVINLAWQHVKDTQRQVLLEDSDFGATVNDAGINCGVGDTTFRSIVSRFMLTATDQKVWQFVPELYATTFRSSRWTSARYEVALGGHNNNAHCIAVAVANLLGAIYYTLPQERMDSASLAAKREADLTDAFQRLIRCSAYSLLHMYSMANFKRTLPHSMVILETLVQSSDGRVDASYLESFFPFTMIRFNVISLFEQQTKLTDISQTEKEEEVV